MALLVGGDAAALLLFAAVGRGSHAELDGIAGVLDTAWPFLLGACICQVVSCCVGDGSWRDGLLFCADIKWLQTKSAKSPYRLTRRGRASRTAQASAASSLLMLTTSCALCC